MNQNIIKIQDKSVLRERFKKAIILSMVFLIFLFISQTVFVRATSGSPPAWQDWETSDQISSFGRSIFGLAYDVYSGESLLSNNVINNLNINFNSSQYAPLWNAAENIYNIIATTGTLLLLLYWLMDLLEKVQMESFTLEHFVRASIKLMVGIILITNGLDLLRGILGFANAIFADLGTVTADNAAANPILNEIWEEAVFDKEHFVKGKFPLIGRALQLIIPSFAMLIIRIVIYVVVYARIIELFVLSAFAPIGMSNIYTGGMNSSGFRYLKKILAVALTGCVMLVVLRGYFMLSSIINADLSSASAAITQLVLGATVLMLVIKSQTWAKDVVGV